MSRVGTADASEKSAPFEGAPTEETASFAGTRAGTGTSADAHVTPGAPGTPGTGEEEAPLSGIPRQPPPAAPAPPSGTTPAPAPGRSPVRTRSLLGSPLRSLPRPWRLLPTPTGTPFTFGYTLLLVATSLFAEYADPGLVYALLQASSTDVEHLAQAPLLVLVASALWLAGGMTSAYALAFLFVLTALERRVGALRTAAVFFGGHAIATLATELPVGAAVALGHLPADSLQRLDYGVSFGVMACMGALTGLLPPWARWPLLAAVTWFAVDSLLVSGDPVSDSGHLLALVLGVLAWPLLRRRGPREPAIVSARC
ncbi:rhomboid-like protein [Streptomyces sp. NPDC059788]|uniref:rhomboid-like protein n=1 Tax=Streptomyces sp. NPDC059788 TaxID=3346948 RepID=UPI003668E725